MRCGSTSTGRRRDRLSRRRADRALAVRARAASTSDVRDRARRRARPRARCDARVARARARGRHPPGRAVAGAPLVSRSGRDLRDQRDGHGQRARGRARRRRRARRRQRDDATSATRTASGSGPTARTSRWAATTRTAQQGLLRSWSTAAYRDSFFARRTRPRLASARAGNVIGGGDWGEDRLIPDLMRGGARRRAPSTSATPGASARGSTC